MNLGLYYDKYGTYDNIPIYNNRRLSHTWVLGKSGVGKSTSLIRWFIDDIYNDEGACFFDPHGESINEILLRIPQSHRRRIILLDFSDRDFPVGFNILDNVPDHRKAYVASSVVDTFKSIWGDSWGPQLEMFIYAGIAALLDAPDTTLVGLKFLITSKSYRKRILSHVKDPAIKDFWETDFETHMPDREQRERTLSTLNKIGAFISDPTIRNSIGQVKTSISLKDIIDKGQILLISIPQGQLGIEKSKLIGSLILSQLHLTALSRTSTNPFHLYIDEVHHFAGSTLTEMLSGIRKFHISLVLAHQYIDQLSRQFFSALIGNVGTIVCFRVGIQDSKILTEEMDLDTQDYRLNRLKPFTAQVREFEGTKFLNMFPSDYPEYPFAPQKIRNLSRSLYSVPRETVEKRIYSFIKNTS